MKRPVSDENGEEFPPLDPNSDVAKTIHLLEWARARRFRLGPVVQVGDVIINVVDLDQVSVNKRPDADEVDIWTQAGHKD